MTAQELKNSILQLAIQGKLVKQNPNDEPASVLLERIKEEREKLIKEKKIKKEKYSEIYKDPSDNHYYEKFEDGTIKEITEVIPFEIPNSWKWIHFGELFYTQSGLSYKKDNLSIKSNNMFTIFRGGNIGDGEYFYKGDDLQISEQFVKENTILKKNCYITPSVTSIEHIGKLALIDRDLNNTVAGGFVLIIYPVLENVELLNYFLFALSSKYHKDNCKKITNKSGQAFYNLSREKLMQLIIPLPPLAEQTRIAEKIRQFLPYINNYDSIYSKIESLNTNYKDELKKSILQYAIQGKLVKQDANDEPAEVLINKILDEKRELIKTKQIKKENLSVIYKDPTDNQFYEKFDDGKIVNITEEIPFYIPDSWRWTRLNNIVSILGDGLHGTPTFSEKGEYYFINGNNLNNGSIIIKPDTKKVDVNEYNKYKKELNNNTMFISINGTVGNIAFYNNEQIILGKSACFFNLINEYLKKYLFYFFKTDYFIKYALINATGTTIRNVSLKVMRNTLIPIPSLVEQEKIVKKLNHITNIIKTAE